jgi:poly(3-hydroxybutyrate) depolymerase
MTRRVRNEFRTAQGLVAVVLLALSGCGHEAPTASRDARLPTLPIDPGTVTVSGLSAGGYMAVQFHVAHSALVQGAGVLAAGPYLCAEGSMRLALGRCMKGDEDIPTDRLLEETSLLALDGSVDPIAGLADDRVWIFHGSADRVFGKPVVDALEAYYRTLVNPEQVVRVEHPQAAHTFPTAREAASGSCWATESPFVGNCRYDGAGTLLAHLYGALAPGSEPGPGPAGLTTFDQRPYAKAGGSVGLAERGWLFVPPDCAPGAGQRCRLHIVFHGCKQGASYVGEAFVRGAGYLEVAQANRIVLLFPQIEPGYQPLNPNGCWDWWGYEGEDYATQRGPQVMAVRAMVADLLGETRTEP